MEVELERMEGQLSLGQEVDMEVYSRISGNLRRILESIGLGRVMRDATGTADIIGRIQTRYSVEG